MRQEAGLSFYTMVSEDLRLATSWGLSPGADHWSVPLRILVVIDEEMTLGFHHTEFGLGPLLLTLQDRSFAWWVRFEVDVAWRGKATSATQGLPNGFEEPRQAAAGPQLGPESPLPIDQPVVPDLYGRYYLNFRFSQADFNIDDYDQVWFFGWNWDNPDDTDDATALESAKALDEGELRLLAEWMDRGGGVLATGDHANLGASLCSQIPRVRTMRKWTSKQGVPDQSGPNRHSTFHPVGDFEKDEWESDAYGQPIEPVYRLTGSYPALTRIPHPLLCTPKGVIDTFPDHMHEGEVIADNEVELDKPLDIPGYDRPEYPPYLQVVMQSLVGSQRGRAIARPTPRVIAYGYTTHNPTNRKRFGLVGVYDGDGARVGRIVVDSTWHHWLSYNLFGFATDRRPLYRSMQAYYRNVALWLARRQQRAEMMYAAIWGAMMGSSPMRFWPGMEPLRIGEVAVDAIGRTASQCTVFSLTTAGLNPLAVEDSFLMDNVTDRPEPGRYLPSLEHFNRAIIGGVGAALLDNAVQYREASSRGERPILDGAEIGRLAGNGVTEGYRTFADSLRDLATSATGLGDAVSEGIGVLPLEAPVAPLGATTIRIVCERLRFTEPNDPALADRSVAFTVEVRLADYVGSTETTMVAKDFELEVPALDRSAGVVDLDMDLGVVEVRQGERLVLDIRWLAQGVNSGGGAVRFRDILVGDPARWRGRHVPTASQAWQLWYRVEAPGEAAAW